MKKITFALACASTCALFADPWSSNAIGFEDYTTVPFTGLALNKDDGTSGGAAASYWLYSSISGSEDGSTVKAYGGDNLAAPEGTSLSGEPGNNYLELSTEGGTLWRSFQNLKDSELLGEALSVGEGLYIDTMVQFTPTEDCAAPETSDDDKLAIWLAKDAESDACTLKVKCRTLGVDSEEFSSDVAANGFALTSGEEGFNVQPGTWYRLTVKAVANITADDSYVYPGFMIYLDGKLLKCVGEGPLSSDLKEFLSTNEMLPSGMGDLIDGAAIFPALVVEEDLELTAVGFKGSGAVDDIVLTDAEPAGLGGTEPPAPADIAFTIDPAEGASANLTIAWATTNTESTEWTAYAAGATVASGTEKIYVKITNADGASKIVEKAIGDTNEFTVTDADFGWAEYLGAAIEGAYVIDNKAELDLFLKGFNKGFATADTTFKLAADIDLDGTAWAGIGTYNVDPTKGGIAFAGTFDGNGKTISNVTFASGESNNYRGFFNQLVGATVKDLTINGNGFGSSTPSGEYGCALIAGHAYDSTIENCTAKGTIASATHNAAGIVIRMRNSTIKNCTNEANITGSYTKLAGIVALNQNTPADGACLIEGCVNKGTITAAAGDTSARDGLTGIVAYIGDTSLTIKNCENKGNLVDNSGSASKRGQIVGYTHTTIKALEGTNKGLPGILAIGDGKKDGLNYATVADGVATYVADSALAANGSYLVTTAGNTPAITLGANQTIAFDETLATITQTGITAAEGYELKSAVSGKVTTWSTEVAVVNTIKVLDATTGNELTQTAKIVAAFEYASAQQIASFTIEALQDCAIEESKVSYGGVTKSCSLGLASGAKLAISQNVWTFSDAAATFYADIRSGLTVEAATLTYKGEVAGMLQADELNASAGDIVLAEGGKVLTKSSLADGIIVPVEDREVVIGTEGDYTSYTLKAVGGGDTYPTYIGAEDAAAKAKFDAWVKDVASIADRDAGNAYGDAYLLNCAVADVDTAKAAFKIKSITVNADGTVTIEGPDGNYNGTVIIKGSATVNGANNDGVFTLDADSKDARFFKAYLQ